MKITIRDVAKAAGVSAASVSLVLNDKPNRITEETRRKIIKTADELGYCTVKKKDIIEESIVPKKIIGVIQPETSNLLVNDYLAGIEKYAYVYGYKVLISNVYDSAEKCIEYIKLLAECGVKGLILIPPLDMNINGNNSRLGEALKMVQIPYLLLDRAIDRVFCDFITVDNKQGAYLATEHLILNGHKNIGIVSGMREVYSSRKRIEGYKEALSFYGLSIKEENIYYGNYHRTSGYEAADYFWERGINALFLCSDEMAAGVYRYAKEKEIEIGEDLSVVGFDDSSLCEYLSPELTSIIQPGNLMGKKAAEIIINRIEKVDKDGLRNTYFAPQLVERKSVKRKETE